MRVAVIPARAGSKRIPRKNILPFHGKPMIAWSIEAALGSDCFDYVMVSTDDEEAADIARAWGASVPFIRPAELSDEHTGTTAVIKHAVDWLRGDGMDAQDVCCIYATAPTLDPQDIRRGWELLRSSGCEYVFSATTFPYPIQRALRVDHEGGVRMFSPEFAQARSQDLECGWHDAAQFYWGRADAWSALSPIFESHSRVIPIPRSRVHDIDTPEDFERLNLMYPALQAQQLELRQTKTEVFTTSEKTSSDEGALIATGQKLWSHAKRVIPGGNMLLSKRAEMFLPEQWPAYFSKAKGCQVWDLDGRAYTDVSIMGIGTNTLGYGHPEVDAAVHRTVDAGNMSTFNCPEEVFLAEKLVQLHPWADMVRLARTGGEANAIAIRIARAASGREKVAVCGYHGWHDWYLSANLVDAENLAGHLLPGLAPNGVPQSLRGTVFPFNYNNYQELEDLVSTHDIGVIKMEVVRNQGPENDFLHKVRSLATRRNIVLIFDECTSGFRQTFGGIHKLYGVEPDMAMFGKAMGNGYAITATIGRREIMEAAQSTFISSTFWTERIGPSAALKTLEVMERVRSWDTITATGQRIRGRWQQLADRHGLKIEHWGLPALTGFTFQSPQNLAYKTLITQEMLSKGYLAGNSVYVCTEHTPAVLDGYFEALDSVLALIRECEDGRDVMGLLKGPVCHAGFKRLN
ncbi:pseudaminic acid cytidylyltransferase [Ramlibacter sp. AN1133]|uniref:pseudaminic acid cytidylyltransferase n=1 Tax=Ramlibacter sp. AN1133 TaxID=3133429 RepID=UPI0030C48517